MSTFSAYINWLFLFFLFNYFILLWILFSFILLIALVLMCFQILMIMYLVFYLFFLNMLICIILIYWCLYNIIFPFLDGCNPCFFAERALCQIISIESNLILIFDGLTLFSRDRILRWCESEVVFNCLKSCHLLLIVLFISLDLHFDSKEEVFEIILKYLEQTCLRAIMIWNDENNPGSLNVFLWNHFQNRFIVRFPDMLSQKQQFVKHFSHFKASQELRINRGLDII